MRVFILAAVLGLSAGCASAPQPVSGEKLYFSLELRREGKVVATPHLLGEEGKALRVERRSPGAAQADYRLRLVPRADTGDGFHLELDLSLPDQDSHRELQLLHGEQRRVELGNLPGKLQLTLLVMKVNSPEFRALMSLPRGATSESPSI